MSTKRTGNYMRKLTDEDRAAIRMLYAKGNASQAAIGACFGVTQQAVGLVLRQTTIS